MNWTKFDIGIRRKIPVLGITLFFLCTWVHADTFSLQNGFIKLSGQDGVVTDLRFDSIGLSSYGSNTISSTGRFGFRMDGTLLTSPSTTSTVTGNQVQISGLPNGAQLVLTLSTNTLIATLSFSGSHEIRNDWDLVYLNAGFYHRGSGKNYNPNATLDIPFESFHNPANGSMRPLEMFKRTAVTDWAFEWWSAIHCRARGINDVIMTSPNGKVHILPRSDKLTIYHIATATNNFQVSLRTIPRSNSVVLDGNKPLPEFYVLPQRTIKSYFDPTVQKEAGQLITEFFHHMTYWWGPQGHSGGIWCDWGMLAGCFMDTPFRESVAEAIASWIVSDDGYGNDYYAYTWGTERGWPFPAGRDTRHFNTNAIFITSLWRYLMWTGNMDFLNSGTTDRTIRIGYIVQAPVNTPNGGVPVQCQPGMTLGQSFTATDLFTSVGAQTPVWGTTDSGCTLTLYDHAGGNILATNTFTNVVDNVFTTLTFGALPAGQYYLEMSDPVGTIGWWGTSNDAYPGGVAYLNGKATEPLITKARGLMGYMQNVLLAGSEYQPILGTNVGSSDHLGRHNLDVGGNYYDILPFGYKDALTNIHYFEALRAIGDLEEKLGNLNVAEGYRQLLPLARDKFNQTFWRTGLDRLQNQSRYIGCVDVNNTDHDYGYTFINTMALAAGLADGDQARADAIFNWLDNGESYHSQWTPDKVIRINFEDGSTFTNPDPDDPGHVPLQLTAITPTLSQLVFIPKPFTSISTHNPTWGTTNSGFTLQLREPITNTIIASQVFTNVVDNSFNTLTFPVQKEGYYLISMSNRVGTIGWWANRWSRDIYSRWVFTPRTCTIDNPNWWQAAVGGNPASQSFPYTWDVQLQNGGCDLYEFGFDIMARGKYQSAEKAWDRYEQMLRRYMDPDRLSGNQGFYGEGIQGGTNGAGSVGWVWSEFPETSVLGSAFFYAFLGAEATVDGLYLQPRIPTGRGITTVGARNISYMGALFDFEATDSKVLVKCTRNPQNKTFYLSGAGQANGTFTQEVSLVGGRILISLDPLHSTAGVSNFLFY